MKIFITGGTGTVGQNVTKLLVDRGDEVVLLTRNPDRVSSLAKYPNVTLLKGTLTDFDVLEEGVKGCDAVIHMALGFSDSPVEMIQKDTLPLAHLLEAAHKCGVKKFITTSSVATISRIWDEDVDEDVYPSPMGTYGGCKVANEMITLGYLWDPFKEPEMKRNVVRPTNCYAVPAFEGGAVPGDNQYRNIVKKILKNEDVVIRAGYHLHSGEQFISGKQVARVFVAILDSEENEEVFFAVGNRFITWAEVAEHAKKLVPESTSHIYFEGELNWRKLYKPDKIKEKFGLEFDGLEDMDEYLSYEIDRARREMNGEELESLVHD